MARSIVFSPKAWEEYNEWRVADPELYAKIEDLIGETARDLFKGRGKPEPLKYSTPKGCWSRRINKEHRLVYKGDQDNLTIYSCNDHY